jgi:hypothetical protein
MMQLCSIEQIVEIIFVESLVNLILQGFLFIKIFKIIQHGKKNCSQYKDG